MSKEYIHEMKKEYLYLEPFEGTILNTMHDGIVDFTGPELINKYINSSGAEVTRTEYNQGLTFDEYVEEQGKRYGKDYAKRIARADHNKMTKLFEKYEQSLVTDWEEISEEQYDYALNVLPPRRYTGRIFFVSEAEYEDIHPCYAKRKNKYFKSMRDINEPLSDIYKSLEKVC